MYLSVILAIKKLFSSVEQIKRDLTELTNLKFEKNDTGYLKIWSRLGIIYIEFCGNQGLDMYMTGIFKHGVVQKTMERRHPGMMFVFGADY